VRRGDLRRRKGEERCREIKKLFRQSGVKPWGKSWKKLIFGWLRDTSIIGTFSKAGWEGGTEGRTTFEKKNAKP